MEAHLLVSLLILLVGISHCANNMVGDREVTYIPLAQNWFTAFEICRAEGKQLLTIISEEENDQIAVIAEKYLPLRAFWLAATDLGHEGSFVWTTSGLKVSYGKFSAGQPDNYNDKEHCLEISYRVNNTPMWNDIPCGLKNPYFCEEMKQFAFIK